MIVKKIILSIATLLALASTASWVFAAPELIQTTSVEPAIATTTENISSGGHIYFFGRESCRFCQMEEEFLDELAAEYSDLVIERYDIELSDEAKALFDQITEANEISKITPLTLVGGKVIQGYNSPETTGQVIRTALERAQAGQDPDIEQYFKGGSVVAGGDGCDEHGEECAVEVDPNEFVMKLPVIGVVDLTKFSLVSLAAILGFVDGFNPCAMWVLVTFLLILMQIGDRRKLLYVAGLFMLAEAIMYGLILNVWYKTWDFVGLDGIVTPLVGVVAIGGGLFFLYKYIRAKDTLTCDITSIEQQSGIEAKIQKLVHSPLTLATALGIIGIAFSVNVIEFACSIGIPQAFTKILELNVLTTLEYQGYIGVYLIAYMIDDLIVFGLAYWGIDRLHASYKYTKLSMLIGGVLMIVLGAFLLLAPEALKF